MLVPWALFLLSTTISERKWDIYMSKSWFGCRQPETNRVLKIEHVAIV